MQLWRARREVKNGSWYLRYDELKKNQTEPVCSVPFRPLRLRPRAQMTFLRVPHFISFTFNYANVILSYALYTFALDSQPRRNDTPGKYPPQISKNLHKLPVSFGELFE